MIVAAGLTPAWQQILLFDRFQPGQVNRAREAHWCGSGKVLNVGLALHHLGGPCQMVALIGGIAHEEVEREFAALQVPRRWVVSEVPTRICTTLLESSSGETTELVENAKPVDADDLLRFKNAYSHEVLQAEFVVLTGSLPSGTPSGFYRDILKVTPCPAVLDVRGEELLSALEQRPLLVKPNRDELSHTLGRNLQDDTELHRAMHELNERGAQWTVVSDGKNAVWASHRGKVFRFQPPLVEAVVNPIGCGDSMAAGIAWALRGGHEPVDAVRFGIAAAVENLGTLLPARLDVRRVAALAGTISGSEWNPPKRSLET